jgi:uncharacterized membrane protein
MSDVATPPKQGRYHLGLLRKTEYAVGELVPFSSVYECIESGELKAFKKGETFSVPDEGALQAVEVTWVPTDNIIEFFTKNLNVEYGKIETVQLRIAELITDFAGSMGFVYFHILWFGTWILLNNGHFGTQYVFDPFPYGLLTMIVSLEAIFLATFIMISQNVQSKRSEIRAELDYQTNISAEKGVAEILALLKELKEHDENIEEEELETRVNPKGAKKKLRERLKLLREKRAREREEQVHDMDGND